MSKKAIICDLDGCLFDDSHRKHLIGSPKEKPYARYHSQHLQDIAIEHTLKTIQHYIELGSMVLFITGRPSDYFGSTVLQIEKYIGHEQYLLFMRHNLDEETSSPDLKRAILQRVIKDFDIIAAYDDRFDIVDMYRDEGLAAAVCDANGCTALVSTKVLKETLAQADDGPTQPQPTPPPNRERDAGDVLRDALATYYDRRAVYGVAHEKFGNVMAALFPEGVTLKTTEDHQLWHMVGHIAGKLTRFAGSGLKDHDSVLDISTYAALAHVLVNGANIKTGSKPE